MADRESVVVSSTIRDLPAHREEVRDACLRLGMYPLMMEHIPASAADAIRESLRLVNQANIYVGVFAHRYGHIPPGHEISITEMEYNRAVERNIDCLIFIMGDDHPITIGDVEFGDGPGKLGLFKDRLKVENVVNFFKSPEQLGARVIHALSQYRRPAFEPFQLVGPQQILYEALVAIDPGLGDIYLGALMAFERRETADRYAQAAHSLRELIEKLPKYLDLPVEKKPPSLKEKVRALSQQRDGAVKNSTNRDGSVWRGEIDDHLHRYLTESDEFFQWFSEEHLTRRRRTIKVLRGLDPSSLQLPEPLEDSNVKQWERCHGYFQGVSHHTVTGVEETFREQLSVLESFLLDRLAPRTSEDFASIDELIREVEAGGNS